MEIGWDILLYTTRVGSNTYVSRHKTGTAIFERIMTPQSLSCIPITIPLHALRKTPTKPINQKSTSNSRDDHSQKKMYRCRACSTAIAHVGDEISVGDIPVDSMQINPHGYIHEIFTVRSAFQVIITGQPVPADSWFPGYMWRFCLCAQCSQHLGWSYQRNQQDSIVFFGLRRGSVKED